MKLGNVTTPARWYDDACGTALAMQLVGERWSMLIVRELMYGPRRFSELRAGLPGISANTLTQRLGSLERAAILARRTLPPPASVQVYELTPWGYQGDPVIQAMSRWALASPLHDPTLHMSGASLIMSMRTLFVAERAAGLSASIGVRLGRDRFVGRLEDRAFEVRRCGDRLANPRSALRPPSDRRVGGAGPRRQRGSHARRAFRHAFRAAAQDRLSIAARARCT